jgi:hypothetical protein
MEMLFFPRHPGFHPGLLFALIHILIIIGGVILVIWFWFFMRKKEKAQLLPADSPGSEREKVLYPLRLQSCERLILFLERITPGNLVLRVHQHDLTASQFHAALIQAIREEFEYNLSQQLFVSTPTWELVRNAKEEMISTINQAASRINENATPNDLVSQILQSAVEKSDVRIKSAIEAVKKEI